MAWAGLGSGTDLSVATKINIYTSDRPSIVGGESIRLCLQSAGSSTVRQCTPCGGWIAPIPWDLSRPISIDRGGKEGKRTRACDTIPDPR
jgi:hypothetical protein